jgi:hypothetical protein
VPLGLGKPLFLKRGFQYDIEVEVEEEEKHKRTAEDEEHLEL